MLVVSRKIGESICIGDQIAVTISEVRGGRVRLSVSAPRSVRVARSEIREALKDELKPATKG